MKKAIGVLLNDSNDAVNGVDLKIRVKRGDSMLIEQGLIVSNTMNQNQALILIASPGDFKANPTIGVTINDLMLDEDYLGFRHRIREHFIKDGLQVRSLQLDKYKPIMIDAIYE